MIAVSHDVNKIQLSMFSKLAFVGVSNDEGTTGGIHDLDFVLENPLSNIEIKSRNDPVWQTIGEITIGLHCSPCSEASCERTISMQRIFLTARRMRSNKDLLDARLTLIRGLNIY